MSWLVGLVAGNRTAIRRGLTLWKNAALWPGKRVTFDMSLTVAELRRHPGVHLRCPVTGNWGHLSRHVQDGLAMELVGWGSGGSPVFQPGPRPVAPRSPLGRALKAGELANHRGPR